MCGLAGVLLAPRKRPPEMLRRICAIHLDNLVANEDRGKEASGVAVISRHGTRILYKDAVPARTLVSRPELRHVIAKVDRSTACILGHTRLPTKGSPDKPENNHPIATEHVTGVHNGEVRNDRHLSHRHRLPRRAEVDSEALFQLIDLVGPRRNDADWPLRMQRGLEEIEGWFATLSVDSRRPTELLVLKHSRPLSVHYDEDLGALFFSSRYIFLRKVFGKPVASQILRSGYGYCFDADALDTRRGQPVLQFPIAS